MTHQDLSAQLVLLVDAVHTSSLDYHGCFSGWQWESIKQKLFRAGIVPGSVSVLLDKDIYDLPPNRVIVGMGGAPLTRWTGKHGIDKWQLSPLALPTGQLYIPTFDIARFQKQPEVGLFQELAFRRAAEYLYRPYNPPTERFLLNPSIEETLAVLERVKNEPEIAVDVETGYGQINTVGFAWSDSDAIAIGVLPDRCGTENYHRLWRGIYDILTSGSRKIFQNFIYDVSYFSRYGIPVHNVVFDTMWGMKILYPELKSNLGNVGRVFTHRPYWKDDGKVTDEEGQKKNWGNVRDWIKHFTYNCRDTTGTFEAARKMRESLLDRGLNRFYDQYITRLKAPILEMCTEGVPLDLSVRDKLKVETEDRIKALTAELHQTVGFGLNPGSPKQVHKYFEDQSIELPKKYDKATGAYKKSADSSSLKKVRLKHPERKEIALIQEIKGFDKALSSYINFDVREDGRLSYSLNGCGTETLRWAGHKDAWDRGFNIQTIPREGGDVSIKSMFVAPPEYSFLECDLRQAESRFVAYDSADKTLIDMLESGADVHTHVGKAILRQMGRDPESIPVAEFKSTWRQLGKKAGHGLNYAMKPGMFVEVVFNELDLQITKKDAEQITEAYFGLFPGIPRWHSKIRSELWNSRKLTAPSGWERYFYGRYGDDMFKEAFAWRPQHTIPWITNHLMLHLCEERRCGRLDFRLIAQVHDSLILLVPDAKLKDVAQSCLAHKTWHPKVILLGGEMWIPTEVKAGKQLSDLKEIR